MYAIPASQAVTEAAFSGTSWFTSGVNNRIKEGKVSAKMKVRDCNQNLDLLSKKNKL